MAVMEPNQQTILITQPPLLQTSLKDEQIKESLYANPASA
jgi:hypothetical protein